MHALPKMDNLKERTLAPDKITKHGPRLGTVTLLGSVAAFAAMAWAADDPLAGLYGNTLICKTDSMECHVWYNPDGTWQSGQMIKDDKGNWNLVGFEGTFRTEDGKMCRKDTAGRENGVCRIVAELGHKLGDKWSGPSPRDPQLQQNYEIVAGHR